MTARRMRFVLIVTCVAVGVLPPAALLAGDPADGSTPAPVKGAKEDPAAELARQMATLREAEEPGDVVAAYARACSLAPQNPSVRDAYMRRMLKFGRPDVAVLPARLLVKLQPDNHLAWATVGYVHGTKKEYTEAFEATARAYEGLPDNESVLRNLGQLVAWADAQNPPPKLSARSRRLVDQRRKALRKSTPFLRGYDAIGAFYVRQTTVATGFDRRMGLIETEIVTIRQQGQAVDAAIRGLQDRREVHRREIKRLRRLLDESYIRPYYVDSAGHIVREIDETYNTYRYRRYLKDQISQQQSAIDRVDTDIAAAVRQARSFLADMNRKKAELKALQAERNKALAGIDRAFRWDPPAVDGVVTPASKRPLVLSSRKPKVVTPEMKADRLLGLARTYLASHMTAKARPVLQTILSKYPKTPAAETARILLAEKATKP